jgi:glycosyltransferase involved in cell wall biosynthesis
MPSAHHVSLIIPAYNEGERIAAVLEPALSSELINEIVVVDDGSTDKTARVVSDYGVTLIQHSHNLGKGDAMETGYLHEKNLGSTVLLFLDGDLHNLRPSHIDSLVQPVLDGTASMTIGILERTKLQKTMLMKWGAFSGQRALPISLWESLDVRHRHGFGVEAALNATSRHQNMHRSIKRVELSGVTHTGKREKEPTLARAGKAYAQTYGQALLAYARLH